MTIQFLETNLSVTSQAPRTWFLWEADCCLPKTSGLHQPGAGFCQNPDEQETDSPPEPPEGAKPLEARVGLLSSGSVRDQAPNYQQEEPDPVLVLFQLNC